MAFFNEPLVDLNKTSAMFLPEPFKALTFGAQTQGNPENHMLR